MINLKCIAPQGGFRNDGMKHYDGDYKPRHIVQAGDLVIANTDITQAREVIGCPAIVPPLPGKDIIASHHIYITEPIASPPLPSIYLYYLLRSPQLRERCRGFASGTTVLAISPDVIEQAPIALPPRDLVRKFATVADALYRRLQNAEEESRTLTQIRDLLLPKLISGELRVPETLTLPTP